MRLRSYLRMSVFFVSCVLLLAGCAVSNPKEEEELQYRQKGIELLQSSDYEGAVEQFQLALDHANGRISEIELDICYYKAYAQILAEKYEDAKVTYDALINYDNKNGKAYLLRGNLQLLMADVNGACADYDLAIKYQGQGLSMYLYAYEQLSAMGYEEQGQLYLRKAVETKGKTAEFYRQKGQAYILLGEYANAKEQLSMAQNLGDEESKLYMAKVLELEGNFDGAKAIYENYAKVHANEAYAYERLAKVLLEQGHYEDALYYIQQAKNIGNISDEASMLKCEVICYEKIGEFQKAKERMEEYMQKYPLDAAAQKELIFLNSR